MPEKRCKHDFGWENYDAPNLFVDGKVAKIGWENRDPARVKMVCNRNCGAYRYVYLERPKVVKYGPIKKGLKMVPKFKLSIEEDGLIRVALNPDRKV